MSIEINTTTTATNANGIAIKTLYQGATLRMKAATNHAALANAANATTRRLVRKTARRALRRTHASTSERMSLACNPHLGHGIAWSAATS